MIDFNNIDITIDKVNWVAVVCDNNKWIYDTSLPRNHHPKTPCFYSMRFITKGSYNIKYFTGEEELIKVNSLSLISQNTPHSINSSVDLPFEYYEIFFYTTEEFPEEIFKKGKLVIYPNGVDRISQLFYKAHEIFLTKPVAWQFELKAIANEVISILIKNQCRKLTTKYIPANIRKSCDFIRANAYKDKINISELAKEAALSVEHYIRLFKQYYGVTPKQYAITLRLERAAGLLEVTNKSISEISEICGFSSIFYFNKLFKQNYNTTPSKYRDNL